jgi:hypothetical protein
LGARDFRSVRPGVVHAWHNPGPGWLRALMLTSPGAQHVRFFETLGEPITDPLNPTQPTEPPGVERLVAVGRACGLEFLPPAPETRPLRVRRGVRLLPGRQRIMQSRAR